MLCSADRPESNAPQVCQRFLLLYVSPFVKNAEEGRLGLLLVSKPEGILDFLRRRVALEFEKEALTMRLCSSWRLEVSCLEENKQVKSLKHGIGVLYPFL